MKQKIEKVRSRLPYAPINTDKDRKPVNQRQSSQYRQLVNFNTLNYGKFGDCLSDSEISVKTKPIKRLFCFFYNSNLPFSAFLFFFLSSPPHLYGYLIEQLWHIGKLHLEI